MMPYVPDLSGIVGRLQHLAALRGRLQRHAPAPDRALLVSTGAAGVLGAG